VLGVCVDLSDGPEMWSLPNLGCHVSLVSPNAPAKHHDELRNDGQGATPYACVLHEHSNLSQSEMLYSYRH
jgi:hypothetical protein